MPNINFLCDGCYEILIQLHDDIAGLNDKFVFTWTIPENHFCYLCGNAFSPSLVSLFVSKCISAIQLEYETLMPVFSISIQLPICFPFRYLALLKKIEEISDKNYPHMIAEISTLFKQKMRTLLASSLVAPNTSSIPMKQDQAAPFRIEIKLMNHESSLAILEPLADIPVSQRPSKYRSKSNLKKLWISIPSSVVDFSLTYQNSILMKRFSSEFIFSFYHVPLYIAGRYNKLQRNISQTPWLDENLPSVSGYISEVVTRYFKCDDTKFCSAGREDIDVKMLGNGRPFILEICNPRRYLFSQTIDERSSVKIILGKICDEIALASSGTVTVGKKISLVKGVSSFNVIKLGEGGRPKIYRALITSKFQISTPISLNSFVVNQKTPLRVLHRRSNLNRPRDVFVCDLVPTSEDKRFFEVTIKTQAGMYIKEFAHGDFGRTQPSLGNLLFSTSDACELLELDVLNVEMPEWPPFDDIIA